MPLAASDILIFQDEATLATGCVSCAICDMYLVSSNVQGNVSKETGAQERQGKGGETRGKGQRRMQQEEGQKAIRTGLVIWDLKVRCENSKI